MRAQASLGDLQAAVAQNDRILIVLAGPNGAGKSTFFDIFLAPTGIRFVNADLIAHAIDPDDSSSFAYEAAKIAEIISIEFHERHGKYCTRPS